MICRTLLAAVARAVAVIEAQRGPFERSARKSSRCKPQRQQQFRLVRGYCIGRST